MSWAANYNVSLTVKVDIKISCCVTKFAKSPKLFELYLKLFAYIYAPLSGYNLHAKILSNEVFPAPLAPIITDKLAALKIPLKFLRICLSSWVLQKLL